MVVGRPVNADENSSLKLWITCLVSSLFDFSTLIKSCTVAIGVSLSKRGDSVGVGVEVEGLEGRRGEREGREKRRVEVCSKEAVALSFTHPVVGVEVERLDEMGSYMKEEDEGS